MRTEALRKRRKPIARNWQLIFMSLPAIIKIFIFSYLPMIGIVMAFKDYVPVKGIMGSAWNGFDNFRFSFNRRMLGGY